MIRFFIKLFIKDYQNTKNKKVRNRYGILSSSVGIILNIFLFIVKIIIGLLSHSLVITMDAFNNLSDMVSSFVSLLGFYIIKRPPDRKHPFGYARFEYLISLFISSFMISIGFSFMISSIKKILNPKAITYSHYILISLIISILVKSFMRYFYKCVGEIISSISFMAAMKDSENDMLITLYVLIVSIVEYKFHIKIDGIAGFILSIFIIYSSFLVLKDTISLILGKGANESLIHKISLDIRNYSDRILGIHDFMMHDYGPLNTFSTLHIELDAKEDVIKSHELIDDIERFINEKYDINLVIHHDPIVTNDKESNEVRHLIKKYLKSIDKRIKIHDFRVDRHLSLDRVIFDTVLPYDIIDSKYMIEEGVKELLSIHNYKLTPVITFDTEDFNKGLF